MFDSARFEWKEVGGTIVFSNLEKLRAQGSEAKFDLVSAKINNAKNSMFAAINRMLYSDGTGNGSKDIAGLPLYMNTTNNTGTVGGISKAVFAFWRNYAATPTKTTTVYDNLRAGMRTAYNTCSRGMAQEHPQWFVFDQTSFQAYEGTLIANERFTSKESGEGAFKNEVLKFKGAKVAFDEDCPTNTGYLGNFKNFKFNYPKGGWMRVFDAVEPANQTAEIIRIATVATTSINNPRRLGVISNLAG